MPEFYNIFAHKMPKFYIIIGRKIFFPDFFFGGAHPLSPPICYAYGLGPCLECSELGKSWLPYHALQVATSLPPQPPNPGAATDFKIYRRICAHTVSGKDVAHSLWFLAI